MIKKLVHFSDLHIRLFKDHDLYRSILQDMFKQWGEIAPDRIVFTGDLVHSKNQMTPELIEMVSWVLTECSKIAKTIAGRLQVPWKLFQLPKSGISEIEKLLQYKGGLNFVGMNFILNFFESIKKENGTNISYWTGDEGNASMGYAPPSKRLRNTGELVDYILDSRTNTKLQRIKGYLDIDVRKLKEKIKDISRLRY